MRKRSVKSLVTGFGFQRIKYQFAGGGHQEDIAEVGVARATEIGVGKADDDRIAVLVTGAVGIGFGIVAAIGVEHRHKIGLRTYLHHTERRRGSGIGMSHVAAANEGVDKAGVIGSGAAFLLVCLMIVMAGKKRQQPDRK